MNLNSLREKLIFLLDDNQNHKKHHVMRFFCNLRALKKELKVLYCVARVMNFMCKKILQEK